jgi:hypothetical protein
VTDTGAVHHPAAASGRWGAMTLVEQMANVGSEVGRSVRAHADGKTARFDHALARALELFDLTAADVRWAGPRRREILRAREEFCRLFFDPTVGPESPAGLDSYFLQFAVAARRREAPGHSGEKGAAPSHRAAQPG